MCTCVYAYLYALFFRHSIVTRSATFPDVIYLYLIICVLQEETFNRVRKIHAKTRFLNHVNCIFVFLFLIFCTDHLYRPTKTFLYI